MQGGGPTKRQQAEQFFVVNGAYREGMPGNGMGNWSGFYRCTGKGRVGSPRRPVNRGFWVSNYFPRPFSLLDV